MKINTCLYMANAHPDLVLVPLKQSVLVVCEGCHSTLMVQVMLFPPPPPPLTHIEWYMNDSMVKPSVLYLISNISVSDTSTVSITYNASLTISSVNLTIQGFYLASLYGHVSVVNTSEVFVTHPGTCNIKLFLHSRVQF